MTGKREEAAQQKRTSQENSRLVALGFAAAQQEVAATTVSWQTNSLWWPTLGSKSAQRFNLNLKKQARRLKLFKWIFAARSNNSKSLEPELVAVGEKPSKSRCSTRRTRA